MSSTVHQLKRLDDVVPLPDNWDGYGAPAISPLAIAQARKILESYNNLLHPGVGCQVFATVSGGVEVDLDYYDFQLYVPIDRSVEIKVDEEGAVTTTYYNEKLRVIYQTHEPVPSLGHIEHFLLEGRIRPPRP
jgi:hypothetical protein